MANTKINSIKLSGSTSVYDIDLPSSATPSISSLTTSALTVNGTSNLTDVTANAFDLSSGYGALYKDGEGGNLRLAGSSKTLLFELDCFNDAGVRFLTFNTNGSHTGTPIYIQRYYIEPSGQTPYYTHTTTLTGGLPLVVDDDGKNGTPWIEFRHAGTITGDIGVNAGEPLFHYNGNVYHFLLTDSNNYTTPTVKKITSTSGAIILAGTADGAFNENVRLPYASNGYSSILIGCNADGSPDTTNGSLGFAKGKGGWGYFQYYGSSNSLYIPDETGTIANKNADNNFTANQTISYTYAGGTAGLLVKAQSSAQWPYIRVSAGEISNNKYVELGYDNNGGNRGYIAFRPGTSTEYEVKFPAATGTVPVVTSFSSGTLYLAGD